MFAEKNFEGILDGMLGRVQDKFPDLDIREGSVIYSALAPAAAELQNMYIALDGALDECFADTQSREFLVRRAWEYGLAPKPAKPAVWKGVFNCPVPAGSRFLAGTLHYIAKAPMGTQAAGTYAYTLECETPGIGGNHKPCALVPREVIEGLESAELAVCIEPGADQEDTEALRGRVLDELRGQAFGGNKADYVKKICALEGVGGVKVYRADSGAGTVRACIQNSQYKKPDNALLDMVQEKVDPGGQGEGDGLAPIGHAVTVSAVKEREVRVSVRLAFQEGLAWEDVRLTIADMVRDYFRALSRDWMRKDKLIVRRGQIEMGILDIPGVENAAEIRLNGIEGNLTLGADEIPVLPPDGEVGKLG